MFLNRIVEGKRYELTENKSDLKFVPEGYDCVLGILSLSRSLNYDETVIYHEEAALPQYLIIYFV